MYFEFGIFSLLFAGKGGAGNGHNAHMRSSVEDMTMWALFVTPVTSSVKVLLYKLSETDPFTTKSHTVQ